MSIISLEYEKKSDFQQTNRLVSMSTRGFRFQLPGIDLISLLGSIYRRS